MGDEFVPNISAIVAVRNTHNLGFTRVSFTPTETTTGQELNNVQLATLRFRYRLRVWRRPATADDDQPLLDRSFEKSTAEPLVNIMIDPASRIKLEVNVLRRDDSVCARAVLVESFTRSPAFKLVTNGILYDDEIAKIRSYVPLNGIDLGVDAVNIMLVCQRGAGKSSTICSWASVLNGERYVDAVLARPAQGGGVTYGFNVVHGTAFCAPRINFIDSPGVTFDQLSLDAMCVLFDYVVRGRIKLPYVFGGRDRAPTADELRERYFNVPDAPLRDRVHVVGIVFDEDTFRSEANAEKMQKLFEVISKHCRVVGIVTGADRLRRTPMIGNVQEFAGVDEQEIELNLDRVASFAEANDHMLTLAENAQMDVKNVALTSNLLGASPKDEEAFGRCLLTVNTLRLLLDRADDLFASEYTQLLAKMERNVGAQFNDEEAEMLAAIAAVEARHGDGAAPNPNPQRLRPNQRR
jgi:hypothetical protein